MLPFTLRNNFLSVCLLILSIANSSRAQVDWATQMGGSDSDLGTSTASDHGGYIYTTGTFSATAGFGTFNVASAGKGDIYVVRINAATGNVEWVRQLGGVGEDNGNAVVCDPSGNVYCTGRFSGTVIFGTFTLTASGSSDAFLVKIDPATGFVLWARKMGGPGADASLAMTADTSGNLYISGYFQGLATFGANTISPVGTNYNVFIAKANAASGTFAWATGYGSFGYSYGTALSCDAAGDVYMTGNYESTIIFGTSTLTAVQYEDIFISKHSGSTGSPVWAVSAGGAGNDNGYGLVAGSDGYLYTTGKFEDSCAFGTVTLGAAGSADIFICKQDAASGNFSWVKGFGSESYEQANAITQDVQGNLFLTGQFSGFLNFGTNLLASAGNSDAFIARLDNAGNASWSESIGGISVDSGNDITVGPANALYCTGSFQSTVDLGNASLSSHGLSDIFVIRLNSATVGIPEQIARSTSIALLPVPFKDQLTVTYATKSLSINVSDLSGKVLFEKQSYQSPDQLDLDFLSPGLYLVTLQEKQGAKVVRKVIKE